MTRATVEPRAKTSRRFCVCGHRRKDHRGPWKDWPRPCYECQCPDWKEEFDAAEKG